MTAIIPFPTLPRLRAEALARAARCRESAADWALLQATAPADVTERERPAGDDVGGDVA